MNIYSHKAFRDVIRWKLEENGKIRGYRARMAEAAGFQRSFLSHVLNSSVLLTPDHALGLSRFWSLDPDATEYFLALVQLSRSQTPLSRRYFLTKLTTSKQKHEDLSRLLERRSQNLSPEKEGTYYSSWYWSAIHIATSIPKLRTVQAIGQKLRLPVGLVDSALNILQRMGLVEKKGLEWRITKHHLHLAKDSAFTTMNHTNWRQKAITRIQDSDLSGVHYSVVYALSESDIEKIRQLILELIERTKQIVEPSSEEEMVCFLCDFFPL